MTYTKGKFILASARSGSKRGERLDSFSYPADATLVMYPLVGVLDRHQKTPSSETQHAPFIPSSNLYFFFFFILVSS